MSAVFNKHLFSCLAVVAALAFIASPANAQQTLNIDVQNNQSAGGFYFTPLWFGIHDGSFDSFDVGAAASPGLEALAEGGVTGGLDMEFNAAQPNGQSGVVVAPNGFGGAPVFDPNDSGFAEITINDPSMNRYFSFASMIIPSNDAFIGNGDQMAHELFDATGNFNGPLTIQIFGSNIYDAGTEVNDGQGAAFSANGGTSTDENSTVQLLPAGGLDNFVGTFTVAGTEITSGIGSGDLVATITISQVPEPGSLTLLGAATAFLMTRRRRRG